MRDVVAADEHLVAGSHSACDRLAAVGRSPEAEAVRLADQPLRVEEPGIDPEVARPGRFGAVVDGVERDRVPAWTAANREVVAHLPWIHGIAARDRVRSWSRHPLVTAEPGACLDRGVTGGQPEPGAERNH